MSSKFLLETLRKQSWSFSSSATHVIDMIPSTSIAGPGGKYSSVSELAFVGNLDTASGLKIFCEAIDNVAAELGKAGVSVSFVGIPKTIDDVPSAEWIDIYAGNWEEYGLKWNLITAEDSSEILQYLSQSPGRIAVMPSLFDPTSIIGQELLYSGFPFIASTETALNKMIISEDRERTLVTPTTKALSKRFKEIINSQGIKLLIDSFHCSSCGIQVDFSGVLARPPHATGK